MSRCTIKFAILASGLPLAAQELAPLELPAHLVQPVELVEPISNDRILGVMPNFQAISDPNKPVTPLTPRQKFLLFYRETVDPFTFFSAAMGAGMSQSGNRTPQYGGGIAPYGQRLGAAYADVATQSFFSDALLATVLHEDPRYFRMGPEHSVPRRRDLLDVTSRHWTSGCRRRHVQLLWGRRDGHGHSLVECVLSRPRCQRLDHRRPLRFQRHGRLSWQSAAGILARRKTKVCALAA